MIINEHTSPRVASIASRVMKMDKPFGVTTELWGDIKTLAASALTQAQSKELNEAYAKLSSTKISRRFDNLKIDLRPGLFKTISDLSKK